MSDIANFLHNNQGIKIFDSSKKYVGTLCGFSDKIRPFNLIINPSSYTLDTNFCWTDSQLESTDHLFFNNEYDYFHYTPFNNNDHFHYIPFNDSFIESGEKLQNLYLKHYAAFSTKK